MSSAVSIAILPVPNEPPILKLKRRRRGLSPVRYDAEGNTLLSSAEVARRIGIKPETLRKWRKAGRGPDPVKLTGNKWGPAFYHEDEYNRWAAEELTYRDAWSL